MSIQGLGYVGVRAKSLEDWSHFGTRFLGMQLVDKSAKSLAPVEENLRQLAAGIGSAIIVTLLLALAYVPPIPEQER